MITHQMLKNRLPYQRTRTIQCVEAVCDHWIEEVTTEAIRVV